MTALRDVRAGRRTTGRGPHRLVLALCVTAGLLPLGFVPVAEAARPEVHRHACAEQGGTFATIRGVRTCTRAAVAEVAGRPGGSVFTIGRGEFCPAVVNGDRYCETWLRIGTVTWQVLSLVETTTTQEQRGNGEVAVTHATTVLSRQAVVLTCLVTLQTDLTRTSPGEAPVLLRRTVSGPEPLDAGTCEQRLPTV